MREAAADTYNLSVFALPDIQLRLLAEKDTATSSDVVRLDWQPCFPMNPASELPYTAHGADSNVCVGYGHMLYLPQTCNESTEFYTSSTLEPPILSVASLSQSCLCTTSTLDTVIHVSDLETVPGVLQQPCNWHFAQENAVIECHGLGK